MKRTTIFVPESLERDLQLYARKTGKPTAAVVRDALAAYIAGTREPDSLPSFTGAFDSGHADTASRHDDILFRRLDPHGRPSSNKPPSNKPRVGTRTRRAPRQRRG